ncbi:hypothetical protein CDD83_12 [Cordyceps sp. RAO-2017]|nr:hypothetical protein CDD83_12 [Cordyceps sp. RAO-2017]
MPAQVFDLGPGADDDEGDKLRPETRFSEVASDADRTGSLSPPVNVDEEAAQAVQAAAPAAVCPWCGQAVDKALLDDFSRGRRLNVRLQTKFCEQHRKQAAMETWRARKYPELAWDGLAQRFAAHRAPLLAIVDGAPSHYRHALADRIASGRARSTRKEGNLNPGYYGPRGFNLMCDYLVAEFGELLRQRAVGDRVIAGRGSAAFIQSVLVAELAVRLIADDMAVSPDEARAIMEESKALGEMVHDEEV